MRVAGCEGFSCQVSASLWEGVLTGICVGCSMVQVTGYRVQGCPLTITLLHLPHNGLRVTGYGVQGSHSYVELL